MGEHKMKIGDYVYVKPDLTYAETGIRQEYLEKIVDRIFKVTDLYGNMSVMLNCIGGYSFSEKWIIPLEDLSLNVVKKLLFNKKIGEKEYHKIIKSIEGR